MDTNGIPGADYFKPGVPLGAGPVLVLNESTGDQRSNMTEAEKEDIIMQCRDAKSRKEAERIVKDKVPDENVNSLYEGPRVN
jgi:hypothetical protein